MENAKIIVKMSITTIIMLTIILAVCIVVMNVAFSQIPAEELDGFVKIIVCVSASGFLLAISALAIISMCRWSLTVENGAITYRPRLGKIKYFHEEEVNYIQQGVSQEGISSHKKYRIVFLSGYYIDISRSYTNMAKFLNHFSDKLKSWTKENF